MAITAYKFIQDDDVAGLNAQIATEIAATRYPIGALGVAPKQEYPAKFWLTLGIGTGAGALTECKVLQADTLAALNTQITTEIAASNLPIGGIIAVPLAPGNPKKYRYFQVVGH